MLTVRLGRGPPQFPRRILWVFPTTLATIREVPLLPRLLLAGLKSHGLLLVELVDRTSSSKV